VKVTNEQISGIPLSDANLPYPKNEMRDIETVESGIIISATKCPVLYQKINGTPRSPGFLQNSQASPSQNRGRLWRAETSKNMRLRASASVCASIDASRCRGTEKREWTLSGRC
jgi:hypothetical protein